MEKMTEEKVTNTTIMDYYREKTLSSNRRLSSELCHIIANFCDRHGIEIMDCDNPRYIGIAHPSCNDKMFIVLDTRCEMFYNKNLRTNEYEEMEDLSELDVLRLNEDVRDPRRNQEAVYEVVGNVCNEEFNL
jgi:hypothetical protein